MEETMNYMQIKILKTKLLHRIIKVCFLIYYIKKIHNLILKKIASRIVNKVR
jgi:hypothetical protein